MTLLDAPDFVEFQRRYHAFTILQDHVQEGQYLGSSARTEILFDLTNDIFRIIFSARFASLNVNGIYKAALKRVSDPHAEGVCAS